MHILCPHCKSPIEVLKVMPREEIACPSCGSSFRLETGSTAGGCQPGQRIGRFEVIAVVGQGAFGTVYKARDAELDRVVALKAPRAGNVAGPQELDRFLREARSAAQLRHPSIVSLHDVGTADGLPYIVSDFVQGATLADLLSARRPAFRESAELVAAMADALQYAHDRGVVHRDVKPSNILIGEDGRPLLTDFGLAKRDAGEITMTVEGQVLGTPAYMAPEQARGEGHTVDGRSDVYSLGVVLYELLTGEPPFRGTARMLLLQVLQDEPRPPRKLNEKIPRDLQTICLKAMAKEPGRRYQSARDLADDLRRWQKGEPIKARPVGRWERARRWARRNPKLATACALAAAGLLATAVVSACFAAYQARAAADLTRVNGDLTRTNGDKDRINTELAGEKTKAEDSLGQVRRLSGERREQLIRAARREFQRGLDLCRDGKLSEGMLWLASAVETAPEDADDWQHALRANLAAWRGEMCILRDVRPGIYESGRLASPDGKYEWRRTESAEQFWDVAEDKPVGRPMPRTDFDAKLFNPDRRFVGGKVPAVRRIGVFSPNGAVLLQVYDDGTSQLWEVPTGLPRGERQPDQCLDTSPRFSPDGRVVARITESQVTFWDTRTGQPMAEPVKEDRFHFVEDQDFAHHMAEGGLAFSPDGGLAAVAGSAVHLIDLRSGKPAAEPFARRPEKGRLDVVFSRDGETLLTLSEETCLWEAATGKPRCAPLPSAGGVLQATISRDSRLVATGGKDGTVRLWESATGKPVGGALQHPGAVMWLRFAPDNKTLIAASSSHLAVGSHGDSQYDQDWTLSSYAEIRAWNVATHLLRYQPIRLPQDTRQVQLSPGGALLLALSGADGAVRLWEADTGRPLAAAAPAIEQAGTFFNFLTWPRADRPASFRLEECVGVNRLWDGTKDRPAAECVGVLGLADPQGFDADGRSLLFTARPSYCETPNTSNLSLQRWTLGETPANVQTLIDAAEGFTSLTVSRDGHSVLGARRLNSIQVWDAASGAPVGPALPEGMAPGAVSARLSPDGHRLCVVRDHAEAFLWDVEAGSEVKRLRSEQGGLDFPIFSADGKRLALLTVKTFFPTGTVVTVVQNTDVRVVSAESGEQIALLPGLSFLTALAFSPDGKRLATVTGTELQVWDADTGKPVGSAIRSPTLPQALAFSPDGRTLVTCCENRKPSGWLFQRWDTLTGAALGTLFSLPGGHWPPLLCYLPDGQTLLTAVSTPDKEEHYSIRYSDAVTGTEKPPPSELKEFADPRWGEEPDWTSVYAGAGRLAGRVGARPKWLLTSTARLVDQPPHETAKSGGSQSTSYADGGSRFVTITPRFMLELRDAQTGKAAGPAIPARAYWSLENAMSGDGRLLVQRDEDGRPRVWDLVTGKPASPLLGAPENPFDGDAAFSPDGKMVLTWETGVDAGGKQEGRCRLWDVATGDTLSPAISALRVRDYMQAFSPDGRTLLLYHETSTKEPEAILWDVAGRKARGEPLRRRFDVAAFSPDGQTLWTALKDGKGQTWDVTTAKLRAEFAECPPALRAALRFSPDGRIRLKEDGMVDVATGRPVGKALDFALRLAGGVASADGVRIGYSQSVGFPGAAGDAVVRRFPEPVEGNAARIKCWVETITGMELDADGAAHLLGPDAWQERKRRLDQLGGPPVP